MVNDGLSPLLSQIGARPSLRPLVRWLPSWFPHVVSSFWHLVTLFGCHIWLPHFGCCLANEGSSLLLSQIGTHPSMLVILIRSLHVASALGFRIWLLHSE